MQKKLSLLFIRFAPFLLAISVLLKTLALYCVPSLVAIEVIDVIIKLLILIGFIILSHTFIFCIYHRILLYCIIVCYLLYLIHVAVGVNTFLIALFSFLTIVTIVLMCIVIYTYLKQK